MNRASKIIRHIKKFLGLNQPKSFFELPEEERIALIKSAAIKARQDQEALLKKYDKIYSKQQK
ncbi:MAG: hypothetical protein UT32_C0023G0003 [Parcubacteria group bacterium GW2011_GWC2_39_14]|nr:MAG: hypothetical protein UT32_C0023G0003 [Parcubacteria group bacterium GW2011_GWC2_39_14]KKR53574.1 MAG: hypothetical protein UT91_C0025G0003 [Parcubacteria group bacterium GW2011_GWA2_40_23]